jgi:hypothetical protein
VLNKLRTTPFPFDKSAHCAKKEQAQKESEKQSPFEKKKQL